MIKGFFSIIVLGVTLQSATHLVQVDLLALLSKLAWVTLPVILVVFGNRYFKKKDEAHQAQKALFEKIDGRMESFEGGLDDFKEKISAQNAQFNGIMAKLEATTNVLSEVHKDVKEHERIINRLQGLLKNDVSHG